MSSELTNSLSAPRTNGGGALARGNEQRAVAEVQAAVLMAKRFPRDQKAAVDRILQAFSRPALAEQSQYQFARGSSDIAGLSIRAAEAIAQQWGNMEFGFREMSRGVGPDGVGFSEVEAFAWDLETMTRKPLQFVVRHWRDTKGGGYALRDERDIYELTANMAQRRVRACILSIIPGDVAEAATRQADVTMKLSADASKESVDRIIAAFATLGVTRKQIETRIQRSLEAIKPANIISLRKIYESLRDGISTPADWFAQEDGRELSSGGAKQEASITLEGAKALIHAAVDEASANRAKAYVARMAEGKDKIEALRLMAELMPPAATAQPVGGATSDAPTFTYADVCSKIQLATTKELLDEARDVIQYVKNENHRKELRLIAEAALKKLEQTK